MKNEYQIKEIKLFSEQYQQTIITSEQTIINLKKKKIGKFKNMLLKILSLGLYDWNKKIDKEISCENAKISFFTEKIQANDKLIDENNKTTTNQDNPKQIQSLTNINKINTNDLTDRSPVSEHKTFSPKLQ